MRPNIKRQTIENLKYWLSEKWRQSESKVLFTNNHLEAIKVNDDCLVYCEDIRARHIVKKVELPISKRELLDLIEVK